MKLWVCENTRNTENAWSRTGWRAEEDGIHRIQADSCCATTVPGCDGPRCARIRANRETRARIDERISVVVDRASETDCSAATIDTGSTGEGELAE